MQAPLEYLKILFWLKWKLLMRGYLRNTTALVGTIVAILFLLPASLAIAVGCAAGFWLMNPPANEHLLRALLLGVYLIWILLPLMGYALNESYDVSRLFVYPISARTIFIGSILGSLIDFPVLLLLPSLLAVVIGFARGPVSLVIVPVLVVLYLFHTLALSQAVLLLGSGFLQSRRFRDVAMVLGPLMGMGIYVGVRYLSLRGMDVNWRALVSGRAWDLVNFLPSGLAARGIAASSRGLYADALLYLLALAVITYATVRAAGWLLQRAYLGEGNAPSQSKTKTKTPAVVPASRPAQAVPAAARKSGPLYSRPVVQAVAEKEFRYMLRDPYFKVALLGLVYMLAVFGFMRLQMSTDAPKDFFASYLPAAVWMAAGFSLFSEMQLLLNLFGTDGFAASVLFLTPAPRRDVLLGKDLAVMTALFLVNAVLVALLCVLMRSPAMFIPVLVWMESAIVVCAAVGNVVSIYMPRRVVVKGWRMRNVSAGQGCAYAFLWMMMGGVSFVLIAPTLGVMLAPAFWVSSLWFIPAVGFCLLYGGALFALSLRIAEPLLVSREIEMIAQLSREES